MKYLLLLLTWLLVAGPAAAQASPVAARPDSLRAAQTMPGRAAVAAVPDTVAAIHRLFAARRKRHIIIAGVIVGAAAGATIASSARTDHFLNQKEYAKLYGIMAAVAIGIDFLAGTAFSRSEERQAVADFQEHRLPKYLKRKLKRRY